tara:strand:- start:60042 stop:60413 length:372 start_codon:yes stop_codon:yes gene_type:complete
MVTNQVREGEIKMSWKKILKEESIVYDNAWSNATYNKFLNQLRESFHMQLQRNQSGKFEIESGEFSASDLANHMKNFAKPKYQGYVNGYSDKEREEITAKKLDGNSTLYVHFIKFLRKTGNQV